MYHFLFLPDDVKDYSQPFQICGMCVRKRFYLSKLIALPLVILVFLSSLELADVTQSLTILGNYFRAH